MRAADSRSPRIAVEAARPRNEYATFARQPLPERALEALDEEGDRIVVASLVEREDAEVAGRVSHVLVEAECSRSREALVEHSPRASVVAALHRPKSLVVGDE